MKRIAIALLSLLLISLTLPAQNSENRAIRPFDELVAFGNVVVYVTQADTQTMRIETENIEMEKVIIEVKGKVLTVKLKAGIYKKDEYATVYVTTPLIRTIKAQAGSQVLSENTLTGDKLEISSWAGARVLLDVEVTSADFTANEGGFIEVSGKTDFLSASANNGGTLTTLDLDATEVYAKATIGGQAKVAASDHLEAVANAGGKVFYFGKPKSVDTKTSLGGKILEGDR